MNEMAKDSKADGEAVRGRTVCAKRARTDLWEPRMGDLPGRPSRSSFSVLRVAMAMTRPSGQARLSFRPILLFSEDEKR